VHLEHKPSEQTKEKMRQSQQKRREIENQNDTNPCKGTKHTEDSKKKMSESHIGHITTDETKDKISLALKDKPRSEQAKKNISLALKYHWSEVKRKNMKIKIDKLISEVTKEKINYIKGE